MKKIINKQYYLNRYPPDLFSESERKHFVEDFKVLIKEIHYVLLKKSFIVQLLLFQNFQIKKLYCSTRKISAEKKIKAYLKILFFPERRLNKAVWVLNQWSFGYFHWLTEVLPRLTVAIDEQYNDPVLLPEKFLKNDYIKESLSIFKRDLFIFSFYEKIRVDSLFAPSHLEPAQFDSNQIKKVVSYFRAHDKFDVVPFRKIYISRSKATRRFVLNEDAVEKLLLSFGFEKVFMEDLNFNDQRKLMAETKFLISNHGAGLTNMMFMNEGESVIELKANAHDINNCFFNLARALDHRYYYTINESDNFLVQKANVTVDTTKLKTLFELLKI